MKKPMAVSYKQLREEAAIKELRDGERSFFIAISCTITSIVILGQLVAHVLTS